MSSDRRIQANQRNARRSTGPRTAAGKAVSRLNALTHGAFANDLLLPGEDAPAFHRLEARYLAQFKPATPSEAFLVQRMIMVSWRLPRLAAMESRVLSAQMENGKSGAPPSQPTNFILIDTLFKLARYQICLERSFYRARKLLDSLRS
jgi:hypothetical protein